MITIKKKLGLGFLGEEYADSYLVLRALSMAEYELLADDTVKDTVTSHFIEGKINQDGKPIDITSENLYELPGEVFAEAFKAMVGEIDPKPKGQ